MEENSSHTRVTRKQLLWVILGFFALTFTVYGYSLHNAFVLWDDTFLIYGNPDIRGMTLTHLKHIFSTYDPELYIPLTFMSYQFDYMVAGRDAFMFHLHSLLDHTANALLAAWLFTLLTKNKWAGIFVGLLFAVHPLNTEAVAWASARKDVLSTFFFLASLVSFMLYRENHKRTPYYASLVFFTLGLLAKVMVVMLPIILVLIDFRDRKRWNLLRILEKIPFFLLSVLFGVIAIFGKRDVVSATNDLQKILMACKSTVFYLEKLFVPTSLAVIYPYTGPITLASPDFYIPVIVVALLILVTLWSLTRTREMFFGVAFFLITLIPTFTNFSKGGDFYFASDRYVYIPSLGIFFLVAVGLRAFCNTQGRYDERERRIQTCVGLSAAAIVVFAVLAIFQSLTWQDSSFLFENVLKNYPDAIAARINLAVVDRELGKLDDATQEIAEAEKINPNHPKIATVRASILRLQGRREEAVAETIRAVKLAPLDPEPHYGLGLLYSELGRKDDALREYQTALFIEPDHVGAMNDLAALYLSLGDIPNAEALYRRALALDDTFAIGHLNLGIVLEKEGKFDEAIAEYRKSISYEPDLDTISQLADLLVSQKRYDEAVAAVAEGMQMKKNDPNFLNDSLSILKEVLIAEPQNTSARAIVQQMIDEGLIQKK